MPNQPLDFTRFNGPVTIADIQTAYRDQRCASGQHPDAVKVTSSQFQSMLASMEQVRFKQIRKEAEGYEILGLPIELAQADA